MRRAGGVLQRRGAEEERTMCWIEIFRRHRAVTGMPSAGAGGVSRVVVGPMYDFQRRTSGCHSRTETGMDLVKWPGAGRH